MFGRDLNNVELELYSKLGFEKQTFFDEVRIFLDDLLGLTQKELHGLLGESLLNTLHNPYQRCIFEAIEDHFNLQELHDIIEPQWSDIREAGYKLGIRTRSDLKRSKLYPPNNSYDLFFDIVERHSKTKTRSAEDNPSASNVVSNNITTKSYSYVEMVKRLRELGCEPIKKMKGSHQRRKTPRHDHGFTVIKPHGKNSDHVTKLGTRKHMIKKAGFSIHEF